jgi:hypothetical protein
MSYINRIRKFAASLKTGRRREKGEGRRGVGREYLRVSLTHSAFLSYPSA